MFPSEGLASSGFLGALPSLTGGGSGHLRLEVDGRLVAEELVGLRVPGLRAGLLGGFSGLLEKLWRRLSADSDDGV